VHYERVANQAQREAQTREQEWNDRIQSAEQAAAQLELRFEQMRNERDQEARAVREAQVALEERTRQVLLLLSELRFNTSQQLIIRPFLCMGINEKITTRRPTNGRACMIR